MKSSRLRPFPTAALYWLVAILLLPIILPMAGGAIEFKPAQTWPGADLFTNGAVWPLQIQIAPAGMETLRREPREFVTATVTENGRVYPDVAVHLKGSVGSFREIDDKPDLTLDFDRFNAGRKFHNLRRIHLNNSVEDPSYCNELLGGELFRAAGVPAPRVAHAVVTLNERRLGLYVLKEGFTEDFLKCYFNRVGGNLYEPADGHDVNQKLKRNTIQAPRQDRSPLGALAAAALEPNPARRWNLLQRTLDVDEFVTFMAMEVMVGHRDGYSLARNNYRVYFNVDSSNMVFFPHGMDQLFGNPSATWTPRMVGLVASSVFETAEGRQLYKRRFEELFTSVYRVQALQTRVDQALAGLRPALTGVEFASVKEEAEHVKTRIADRQISLRQQLSAPEPAPVTFANGFAHVSGWARFDDSSSVRMRGPAASDDLPSLRIAARAASGASWRVEVLLPHGRYRFEGRAKVVGVKPLSFGRSQGARLRVAGGPWESGKLLGDSDWRVLSAEFDVTGETQAVELICELRASAGEAWFDENSLKLVQSP